MLSSNCHQESLFRSRGLGDDFERERNKEGILKDYSERFINEAIRAVVGRIQASLDFRDLKRPYFESTNLSPILPPRVNF